MSRHFFLLCVALVGCASSNTDDASATASDLTGPAVDAFADAPCGADLTPMTNEEIISAFASFNGAPTREGMLATDSTQGYRIWDDWSFDLYQRSRECTDTGCSPWVGKSPSGEIELEVHVANGVASLVFENWCHNWHPAVASDATCTGTGTSELACQVLPEHQGGDTCESPVADVKMSGTLTKNKCLILRGSKKEGAIETEFAVFAPTVRRY